MKKIIRIVSALLCFAILSTFSVGALSNNAYLERSQKSGDNQIKVTLYTDSPCAGVQGTLLYDTANFTYVSAELSSNYNAKNSVQSSVKATDGGIKVILLGNLKQGTSGNWITFTFTANTSTVNSAFSFQNAVYADTKGAKLSVGTTETMRGDVNGDYSVNIKDLVRFKKHLGGTQCSFNETNGNCNRNGISDTSDFAILKQYLLDVIPVI